MKREFLFPLVLTFTLLIKGNFLFYFFPIKEKLFTYIDTFATLAITLHIGTFSVMLSWICYLFIYLFIYLYFVWWLIQDELLKLVETAHKKIDSASRTPESRDANGKFICCMSLPITAGSQPKVLWVCQKVFSLGFYSQILGCGCQGFIFHFLLFVTYFFTLLNDSGTPPPPPD